MRTKCTFENMLLFQSTDSTILKPMARQSSVLVKAAHMQRCFLQQVWQRLLLHLELSSNMTMHCIMGQNDHHCLQKATSEYGCHLLHFEHIFKC